jgi:hypothetical protein
VVEGAATLAETGLAEGIAAAVFDVLLQRADELTLRIFSLASLLKRR